MVIYFVPPHAAPLTRASFPLLTAGILLLGIALAGPSIVEWTKRHRRNRVILSDQSALDVLVAQCSGITDQYKRLDYECRDEVRRPLSDSSWPDFGESWSWVQVTLLSLRDQLFMVREMAKAVWETNDWDKSVVKLFDLKNSDSMYDLLAALEEFENIKPQTRKVN